MTSLIRPTTHSFTYSVLDSRLLSLMDNWSLYLVISREFLNLKNEMIPPTLLTISHRSASLPVFPQLWSSQEAAHDRNPGVILNTFFSLRTLYFPLKYNFYLFEYSFLPPQNSLSSSLLNLNDFKMSQVPSYLSISHETPYPCHFPCHL